MGLARRLPVQVALFRLRAAHLLPRALRLARAVRAAIWSLELVKSFWVLLVLWVLFYKPAKGLTWELDANGGRRMCVFARQILVMLFISVLSDWRSFWKPERNGKVLVLCLLFGISFE